MGSTSVALKTINVRTVKEKLAEKGSNYEVETTLIESKESQFDVAQPKDTKSISSGNV